MPHVPDLVGYAAGFLATAAFVPQVAKTFKERSARDISLGMYVLFCAGVALWLAYGLLIAVAIWLAAAGSIQAINFVYQGF